MFFYTVYKTTNKINGKTYIGMHKTTNPNDDYLGSGKMLQRAFEKYGIENFKKEVLYVFDNRQEMILKEKELVNDAFVNSEKTYNLACGGNGGNLIKHLPEEKQTLRAEKISKNLKKTLSKRSNEERKLIGEKISHSKKRSKATNKAIQNIADNRRGKTYEEAFGEEKAKQWKQRLSENAKNQSEDVNYKKGSFTRGRTYEEMYGPEKAAELKEKRRLAAKKNKLGVKKITG